MLCWAEDRETKLIKVIAILASTARLGRWGAENTGSSEEVLRSSRQRTASDLDSGPGEWLPSRTPPAKARQSPRGLARSSVVRLASLVDVRRPKAGCRWPGRMC